MSRYVDTLPPPTNPKEKKVIVLSYGRNGTLGLYLALQKLGYNPCHMRTVFAGGAHELKLLLEAARAGLWGEGERYSKEDLQKWLGEYDAITDITPFILEEVVAAWPDAKFILTTRNEDAWYRSMENTILPMTERTGSPGFTLLKMFNPFLYQLAEMRTALTKSLWGYGNSRDKEAAIQTYRAHNEKARGLVPKDRLIEVKLEDGLDWQQICPFLEKEIPNEPYPRANTASEFKELSGEFVLPNVQKAVVRLATTTLAPCVALGAWYYLRYVRK